MSASERSRARKNDAVAAVLAWRAPRLRRIDHWDAPHAGGRVIVLLRDRDRDRERERNRDRELEVSREREALEGVESGANASGSIKARWEVRRVKV